MIPWAIIFLTTATSALEADTYGNQVTPGRTLTTIPRSFILTHEPLPAGRVSHFRFHSSGVDRKLYLQIWRPLAAERDNYKLVGQVYHCTSYNGSTQVPVPASAPILTESGDLLGFTSATDRVGITYTLAPFEQGSLLSARVVPDNALPVPGNTYVFAGSFFDKMFAVNVHIVQVNSNVSVCDRKNGGCDQLCTEVRGERRCTCRPGYDLDVDGVTCTDVDECGTSPPVCAAGSECVNQAGSYDCLEKQAASSTATENPPPALGWFRELTSDPSMVAVYVWLILLTLIGIVTMVTACVLVRRTRGAVRGSNLNFHNSNNMTSSMEQVTIQKNNRY